MLCPCSSFMVSCLVFKSFYFCVLCGVHLSTYSCPAFPAPLVEETVFSPLCILSSSVEECVWIYYWTLYSLPLIHMSVFFFFLPIPDCSDYYNFVVVSEVCEGYASSFVFLLGIALAILGLLCFHINFSIICSSKKCHE